MSSFTDSVSSASNPLLVGFLAPDDLAAALGISPRTLARWHARGDGPARCMVGKLILYRQETVRAWLATLERDRRTIGPRRHR